MKDGVPLCLESHAQTGALIVSDGAGGAIVAWGDSRALSTTIYARHVSAAGTALWNDNGNVVSTDGYETAPSMCTDGAGGALVSFQIFGPDIRAQRYVSDGTLAWTGPGSYVCSANGSQNSPVIAPDGSGGAFVVWQDARGTDPDIYAEHVLANGQRDVRWPSDGLKVCGAAGVQAAPGIVAHGSGGFVIAWEDGRGTDVDIYALRMGADATRAHGWPADGRPICAAAGLQSGPQVLADDHGGAYVAWTDYRNAGDADLYLQHVEAGGAIVGVPEQRPRSVEVSQASANPSARGATLRVTLPEPGTVSMRVLSVAGRLVRQLDPQSFGAGTQHLAWEGRDDHGGLVPPGIYLVETNLRGISGMQARAVTRVCLVR